MTKNLLQNEIGILTIGSDTAPFALDIPPNFDSFGINSYCPNKCISQVNYLFIRFLITIKRKMTKMIRTVFFY